MANASNYDGGGRGGQGGRGRRGGCGGRGRRGGSLLQFDDGKQLNALGEVIFFSDDADLILPP